MEDIFTYIYENCHWGDNKDKLYRGSSGGGSEPSFNTDEYIPYLKKIISSYNIKTVVDLGCGDFRCGHQIYDDLDILYTGYDVYKDVVEHNIKINSSEKFSFVHLDFFHYWNGINDGDLCILKDVLQHWTLGDIYVFMEFLIYSGKFKYIIVCNCGDQTQDNTDTVRGGFRPLSCKYLPLRRYNPLEIFNYQSKEVALFDVR